MPDLELEAVGNWLSGAASDLSPVVAELHLFGSLLERDSSPSDVDVIIVFRDWNVRGHCAVMRERFRRFFGLPLHIQMFHISQRLQLAEFVKRAEQTRRIM